MSLPNLRPALPGPLLDVASELAKAGSRVWLVGDSLHRALGSHPLHGFELATSATFEELLGCLPRAVVTGPGELALATRAGPAGLSSLVDRSLEATLAQRDFRIEAMALELGDAGPGALEDPFGGLEDLELRRLRSLRDPTSWLTEQPMGALRAASRVAVYGYVADTDLEAALTASAPDVGPRLGRERAARVRREVLSLVGGREPQAAIDLLRRSGLEAFVVPDAREDSAAVVAAVRRDLALRLAAWLRDTDFRQRLARWRIDRRLARRIASLLEHHPVDALSSPVDTHSSPVDALSSPVDTHSSPVAESGDSSDPEATRRLRRLRRRVDPDGLAGLFELRAAELTALEVRAGTASSQAAGRSRLQAVREALDRLEVDDDRRQTVSELALDGQAVMDALGCGPGRRVGQALRHLAERVAANPGCNTREELLGYLGEWASRCSD